MILLSGIFVKYLTKNVGMIGGRGDFWGQGLQDMSRRQIKSFLIQQFFKNVGEVQGE